MKLNFSIRKKAKKRSYPSWHQRKNIPLPLSTYKVVRDIAKKKDLTLTQAFVLLIEHGVQHLIDEEAQTTADTARSAKLEVILEAALNEVIQKNNKTSGS